jgi:hypothetical protein
MTDPNAPFDNTKPPQSPAPAPAPGPAGGAPTGLVSAESPDAKTMAMLCHLLAMLTGLIVPLIIWLIKKDQSPFVNQQGKEVVNFELTLLIGAVVGGATACLFIGFVILAAVFVVNIVFGILATIAVNKGLPYRYPVCIRFIK